jgi:Fic family protein
MAEYKHSIREHHKKIYSQDLINNLFRHPYTRIDYLQHDLGVSRQTAAKYLDELAGGGFVQKHQVGRDIYFINTRLIELFASVSSG